MLVRLTRINPTPWRTGRSPPDVERRFEGTNDDRDKGNIFYGTWKNVSADAGLIAQFGYEALCPFQLGAVPVAAAGTYGFKQFPRLMRFAFGDPETCKTQGAPHFVRECTLLLGRATGSKKALLGLTPEGRPHRSLFALAFF